uniref:Secreted protein n=1 Tax=Panagrellus redivivus TaxID=6233 RepID=A0A7E4WEC3_PANRE
MRRDVYHHFLLAFPFVVAEATLEGHRGVFVDPCDMLRETVLEGVWLQTGSLAVRMRTDNAALVEWQCQYDRVREVRLRHCFLLHPLADHSLAALKDEDETNPCASEWSQWLPWSSGGWR